MINKKWARLLAYVTGSVNQELLLQNEYLAAENRILRDATVSTTTILLLVSDQVGGSVLAEILEREGYCVIATGDLGEAVEWLKRTKPNLLITRAYIQGL